PLRLFSFFFQAEDGIRDRNVTGVQTCALPISAGRSRFAPPAASPAPYPHNGSAHVPSEHLHHKRRRDDRLKPRRYCALSRGTGKIGRASCRERAEIWVVAESEELITRKGQEHG